MPSRRPRAAWRSRICAVVNPEHNCAELDRLVECFPRRLHESRLGVLGVGGGGMGRLRRLWRHNKQSLRNYTVAVVSVAVALGIMRLPSCLCFPAP